MAFARSSLNLLALVVGSGLFTLQPSHAGVKIAPAPQAPTATPAGTHVLVGDTGLEVELPPTLEFKVERGVLQVLNRDLNLWGYLFAGRSKTPTAFFTTDAWTKILEERLGPSREDPETFDTQEVAGLTHGVATGKYEDEFSLGPVGYEIRLVTGGKKPLVALLSGDLAASSEVWSKLMGSLRAATSARAPAPPKKRAWTQIKLPAAVSDVAIHDGRVFAATSRGLYRSADEGLTWSPVNKGLAGVGEDHLWHVYSTPVALFASDFRGPVYRSNDGGDSWNRLSSLPQMTDLAGSAALMFAGTFGDGLFRSTDGGSTWTAVPAIPLGANGRAPTVTSVALAGDKAFAATDAGLFGTADAGGSWVKVDGTRTLMTTLGASNYIGQPTGVTYWEGKGWQSVFRVPGLAGFTAFAPQGDSLFGFTQNRAGAGCYRITGRRVELIPTEPILMHMPNELIDAAVATPRTVLAVYRGGLFFRLGL